MNQSKTFFSTLLLMALCGVLLSLAGCNKSGSDAGYSAQEAKTPVESKSQAPFPKPPPPANVNMGAPNPKK